MARTPSELPVKLPRREQALRTEFNRSLNEGLAPSGRERPSFSPHAPPIARPAKALVPALKVSP